MANSRIPDLTNYTNPDASNDVVPIWDNANSQTKKITRNNYLGISGSPVGTSDSQALSNKTLGNTNAVTLKDTLFTLQDDGDATKQAQFQLSGITAGNTRTLTVPDRSDTIVTLGGAQTLVSKTLTAPVISGGSIDNSTVTIDTISGHTSVNTMTVAGIVITSSVIPQTALPTGVIVQVVNSVTSAVATGTTTIPYDDTIPQNTEGDQYMSLAITPKATTNILVIKVLAGVAVSSGVAPIMALFQDSTANALAAMSNTLPTALINTMTPLTLVHAMTAGTTSATTFKVRIGSNGAATLTFNGSSGGRLFGAISKSSMTITEYKA